MILRRAVRLAPVALGGLVAMTLSVGPSVAQSGIQITAAEAEANATHLRLEDPANFVEDTIFSPPEVASSYAFSKIDRAELSAARAASAYSEYFNLLGAFPELGPAVLPPELQFIFFAFLEFYPPGLAEDVANVSQASVQGRPTQSDEATFSSGGAGEGGVMHASIEEGPIAAARSAYASFPASSLASAGAADSRTVVETVAAGRQATATSVLRDISIGGIIEIDSIRVTATALADGAQGLAEANVIVDGVTVADVPAVIDHEGIRVADSVAPVSVALLNQALETLGVTVTGPGEVVTQPGGDDASASATGPRIRYHNEQDQVVVLTLGRAVAESDRASFEFEALPPPPPPPSTDTPPPTSGPISGPVTVPTTPPAPGPSVPGPVLGAPPAPDDTTAYALDRELLILARDGKPIGILDLYTVLVICALILGGWGAMRPWREP